ncbi:MAG: tetratricopeptide repeat protein [Alphaproteobacteria bacterium]|nr:tetratricopeptide repeat protein [Alphaproteobacteria bacterium]
MKRTFNRRFLLYMLIILVAALFAACGNYEARKTAYFEKATRLFAAGDDDRARLELKNVLQIDDRFAPGWYWLGRVEEREGNIRKAFANFNRAVELDQGFVPARVHRGQIYVLSNDLNLAAGDADAALKLAPADPDALMLRAAVRKRNDDMTGAEEDARMALAAQPGHAAASAMIASLLYEQGDKAGALAALEQGISANPDMRALKLVLGRYQHEAGNIEGAIEVLSALVAENPDSNTYRNRLATYLVQQGRAPQAEQVLRDALAKAPDDFKRQKALIELIGKTRGAEAGLAELVVQRQMHPNNMPLRFAQAGLLLKVGKAEDAEQAYRDIVAAADGQGPDAVRARKALAVMLAAGRSDEAAALLAEVLLESPGEPDALQLRATMALQQGRQDQAINDLRTVLREYPDRLAAQRMLGQAHALNGELALAQDAFEQAIAMAPTDPAAYLQLSELRVRTGDNDGALLVLEGLLEKVPDSAVAQQAIARIQFSRRDWDALDQTAHRIQQSRPEHSLGYYLNGVVAQRKGDHVNAVKMFEKALDISPKAVEVLLGLARSHLAAGDLDQAEQRVRQVLKENPNNVTALHLLGSVQVVAGQIDAARATFDEAIRFHSSSPLAYGLLAQLEEQQGNLERTTAILERGAAETERNGILLFQLAGVHERSGDYDGAIKAYEEVLTRHPQADVVANNLAVLLATGKEGVADLDRALELAGRFAESDVAEYLDTLGWVRYLRGEYQAALPLLTRAVEKNAGLGDLQYHLGMVYISLGDTTKARERLVLALASENFTVPEAAQLALSRLDGSD